MYGVLGTHSPGLTIATFLCIVSHNSVKSKYQKRGISLIYISNIPCVYQKQEKDINNINMMKIHLRWNDRIISLYTLRLKLM